MAAAGGVDTATSIKRICDAMASGFSSLDAISFTIDMKTEWPEFAKTLRNDVENKVLDYRQTESSRSRMTSMNLCLTSQAVL